jgi:hypothetical protein
MSCKKCKFDQCKNCGVKFFAFFPMASINDSPKLVEWKRFALETTMSRFVSLARN